VQLFPSSEMLAVYEIMRVADLLMSVKRYPFTEA
jgi:hypothetical protein